MDDTETDHHYYNRKPHSPSDVSRATDESRSRTNQHDMHPSEYDHPSAALTPKRVRTVSERHDMHADDLHRAARRSRNRHNSHEQQNNNPGWFNSFAKMLGIGITDVAEEKQPIADERGDFRPPSHDEYTQFRHASRAVERHDHPADLGIDDDSATASGSEVATSRDTLIKSAAERLSSEDLSGADLKDLVHLFRRMFTALDNQLNATQSAQVGRRGLPDVSVAIAEAEAANRRREAERRKAFDQDMESDANDDDVDNEEMPPGSPAYESRKRLMRALSAVKDGGDTKTRRIDKDRDHLIDAMSAGFLPYV
ncbi:hypothetical protein BWQ96_08019 [Gracilariopsis chorda]|uniref:Uncharacterized protein n=1 Tax=Gracilariopsis chorda TaxID=448386 RepID=A0A2V3IMG3_9FLOR|nr:hypothetical protein BWQ96_08019 [Gracilariopsis chorda]|eukprot:PXF42300.1 hypothetical protein BWQ96_08019 [Gracilariopsis chorda]